MAKRSVTRYRIGRGSRRKKKWAQEALTGEGHLDGWSKDAPTRSRHASIMYAVHKGDYSTALARLQWMINVNPDLETKRKASLDRRWLKRRYKKHLAG